jgi:hypothetical protein
MGPVISTGQQYQKHVTGTGPVPSRYNLESKYYSLGIRAVAPILRHADLRVLLAACMFVVVLL